MQRVLTRYEGCRILIKNLPLTVTRAEVVTLFTQPGLDPSRFNVYLPRGSDRSNLEAVVEFEDVVDGKNAVAALDGIEFGSAKLKLVFISQRGGMEKSRDLKSHPHGNLASPIRYRVRFLFLYGRGQLQADSTRKGESQRKEG